MELGIDTFAVWQDDSFRRMRELEPGEIDVAILDPPYSARQHAGVRSSKRNRMPDGNGKTDGCNLRRIVDLGFDHFVRSDCLRVCHELARLVRRWSLVFCDGEILPAWRGAARKSGLEVVRTGVWVRIGGAPQFTGDRPGNGAEYVVILHPKGKKRWNGGGSSAVWCHPGDCPIPGPLGPVLEHPIVANRGGQRGSRVHTTQKPVALMRDLVRLFSDPGDLIFDPFAGSGTTGVAALSLQRRFLGIERQFDYAKIAIDRCMSITKDTTTSAIASGQRTLLDAFADKIDREVK